MPELTVVDFGMGNLRSVEKAFERIGVPIEIISSPEKLAKASKIILPGVGHFAEGMRNLLSSGLAGVLKELVLDKKVPILGICLGMQMLGNFSEEGDCEGLGWIEGKVVRFPDVVVNGKGSNETLRVPHVGMNKVKMEDGALNNQIAEGAQFYFVHSYYFSAVNQNEVCGWTNYGIKFASAVAKENIFGVQFHPEKSHQVGLDLLKNFAMLT